jgi:hypothetical protein
MYIICLRLQDTTVSITNLDGVEGQGFFAIFDGHAGKQTADWCAANLPDVLIAAKYCLFDVHINSYILSRVKNTGIYCPYLNCWTRLLLLPIRSCHRVRGMLGVLLL